MYIFFELTDTDMIFLIKDEAGLTLETYTFPLDTYKSDPKDSLGNNGEHIIVRKLDEPLGTYPPGGGSFPRDRLYFINSTTGAYLQPNEPGA